MRFERAFAIMEKRCDHLLRRASRSLTDGGKYSFDLAESAAIIRLMEDAYGEDIVLIPKIGKLKEYFDKTMAQLKELQVNEN